MSAKADSAFRTISEAADDVGVPAHVLRFWESRFPQLQPLKRAGGRRYYRPADMALLRRIKALLQDQGMTIRGAQLALAARATAAVAAPAAASGIDRQALLVIRNRLAAALLA
ncbi:MAG: MerR family transcriptional regulator [Alphaproteobacteria bacterium]|nr:MerR family transcriptional regulator [Alphaproteobacteria bacterium]